MLGPPRQRQLSGPITIVSRRPRSLACGARVAPCVLAILGARAAQCRSGLRQLALALALAALAGCGQSDTERTGARVTKHTDGDTLWLSGIGKVRLIGVDTPEVFGGVECFGRRASAFVERTLPVGAEVRYQLGVEERDRYGRALAYIWLADGRFLNELLVARGYAQPLTVPPNVEYEDLFVRSAQRARAAGLGLWGRPRCSV